MAERELTVNLDFSEVIKELKAVQRVAKDTVKALKEVEKAEAKVEGGK